MYKTVNEEINTLLICVQTAKILLQYYLIKSGLARLTSLKLSKHRGFAILLVLAVLSIEISAVSRTILLKKTRC